MTSLLPPNATSAERALELAMRAGIDLSAVGTLWNPATCPADVLPFLAWGLAISHWDPNWNEAQKRAAIAEAIPFHQIKGTRAAVEEILARFHPLLSLVEWWQANPRREPHTFEVRAPAGPGGIDASFLTTQTAEAIIRDVAAAKPLRSHFDFVFALEAQATLWIAGGVMAGTVHRADYAAALDESRDWDALLQTQDGAPITNPDGSFFLETE
ncbi:MAG: phage tail protein I [Novosphingobium sp. 28-62-57]|uniref:phage tail protein I n=1 Tax=unclassified Novosphingobium TaxID=2644732 RepID=UPI000BCA059E|nr:MULTISPECIES: phage tail protein I [unclassified Novosphingobium]OYW47334.1 MAG: phage tail protein I [Novosphingobium sp. 12-63-9]OYZ08002.1 MAG: phage tail protein I [Novosphingobium sp. 28-62-57]HQS69240.1 phage tail protein I [Novosphingobium sp.]